MANNNKLLKRFVPFLLVLLAIFTGATVALQHKVNIMDQYSQRIESVEQQAINNHLELVELTTTLDQLEQH